MIVPARVASADDLVVLKSEWSDLVERAPDATPFQRPEWLIPWWRQFGSGDMHALAFRCGSRLAGLLGMFIHEWAGRRQVTLIGNGITDYLDLLAEPENASECARLAFEYLAAYRELWDVCDWQDLRTSSPLLTTQPDGFISRMEDYLPCTRLDLRSDFASFEASLPHGLRRTIRIAARRLEREGDLRFETIREDPDAEVVQELFRLHESRWATKGGTGSMLDSPATQQFLIEATRQFSVLGKLRLYTMRYRGALTAIICALHDRGRTWGYITGMDPELSRFSPGSLVLHYAIRDAIGEGAQAWEFLRGDEPYKFTWGAQLIPKRRLCIFQNGA